MPLARSLIWDSVLHLIIHHVAPWDLDEVLVASGLAVGPCQRMDQFGIEKVLSGSKSAEVKNILKRMASEGRVGQSLGWGFYRYSAGGGVLTDPLVDDLISEEARFAKIERVEITDEALVVSMKNACKQVEEQLASQGFSAPDIEYGMTDVLSCPSASWWR